MRNTASTQPYQHEVCSAGSVGAVTAHSHTGGAWFTDAQCAPHHSDLTEAERLARWRLGMQAELAAMRVREIERRVLAGESCAALSAAYGVPRRLVQAIALRALTARPDAPHDVAGALRRLGAPA